MPSQAFRNLDRLAGITGGVAMNEQARKEQLMQAHLSRMQEFAMERRRADSEMDIRTRTQKVRDAGAMSRTQAIIGGREQVERLGIEAGKYKKANKYSWLDTVKDMPETHKAAYKAYAETLSDISDERSGPGAILMSKARKRYLFEREIEAEAGMGLMNERYLIPNIYPDIRGKMNELRTKRLNPSLGNPPKGSENEVDVNKPDKETTLKDVFGEFMDLVR